MKLSPAKQAMTFIAAYECDEPDDYERNVVRIARIWLSLIRSPEPMQGLVNQVLADFAEPVPDHYGSAWEDLHTAFLDWVRREAYDANWEQGS